MDQWDKGHEWNSAVILVIVSFIKETGETGIKIRGKVKLATHLLTLQRQDVWEANRNANASKNELKIVKTKKCINTIPNTLSPDIFKEWFYQDVSKITESDNCIGSMKMIVEMYCRKMHDCTHPEDNVVDLLQQQET